MVVIFGRPPIYERVVELLGDADVSHAWFTYGDKIYSPSGKTPPPEIVEHEKVHRDQQAKTSPQKWWDRWLAEPDFRLYQEVKAYGRQIAWVRTHRGSGEASRQLAYIADMLAGEHYGYLVSPIGAVNMVLRQSHGA